MKKSQQLYKKTWYFVLKSVATTEKTKMESYNTYALDTNTNLNINLTTYTSCALVYT